MPESPINTGGFAMSVMPGGIKYAAPEIYAGAGNQFLAGMDESVKRQQLAEAYPLELEAKKQKLMEPVDTLLGTKIIKQQRMDEYGKPIKDLYDSIEFNKINRRQWNPTTGKMEEKQIDVPGKVIATAEQNAALNIKGETEARLLAAQGLLNDAKSRELDLKSRYMDIQQQLANDKALSSSQRIALEAQVLDLKKEALQAQTEHNKALENLKQQSVDIDLGQLGVNKSRAATEAKKAEQGNTKGAALLAAIRGGTTPTAEPTPAPSAAAPQRPKNKPPYTPTNLPSHWSDVPGWVEKLRENYSPENVASFNRLFWPGAADEALNNNVKGK